MSRSSLATSAALTPFASAALAVGALALGAIAGLGGCSHTQDSAGTTTVTSGSTLGPKVTGARTDRDEASMRLADEMCSRAAACNQIGEGARYPTEEACMAAEGAKAPAQLNGWSCAPSASPSGFEGCLAAVRGERCESDLPRVDRLAACRSVQVCGR